MSVPEHVRKLAREYLDMNGSDVRNDEVHKALEAACKEAGVELRQAYEAAIKTPSNPVSKPTPPTFTPPRPPEDVVHSGSARVVVPLEATMNPYPWACFVVIVKSPEHAIELSARMVKASRWFAVTPLPDDQYSVSVKREGADPFVEDRAR